MEIEVGEFVRLKDGTIFKADIDTVTYYNSNKEYITNEIKNHDKDIINLIEDQDFCIIEFYSPRYEKRVIRIFEVSKIDEYITFENFHCDLFMISGKWSNHDKELKPVIKAIVTKEQFANAEYRVEG